MTAWVLRQVDALLGVVLVCSVALCTIALTPPVAQELERLPWLIYMYAGGEPPVRAEREEAHPLPFETSGTTSDQLRSLGLPLAPGPTIYEVDRDSIFVGGHVYTDTANEQAVLSARRAVWVWDTGEQGLGTEVLIVELPTASWAEAVIDLRGFDEAADGEYPNGATRVMEIGAEPGSEYEIAKVQFRHDRLWVVVQLGVGPNYLTAVRDGAAEPLDTAELARRVSLLVDANLPALDDLEGWDTLPLGNLRLLNAASLGLAATMTILAREVGAVLLDRGSREALTGRLRRRVTPGPSDVQLAASARRRRRRFVLRTIAIALGSGMGLILLYFVTGAMGLVQMFLLVGGLVLVGAFLDILVRRRGENGRLGTRWLIVEGVATALSITVFTAGIFWVGLAGIGFTLGEGSYMRWATLTLLVLGLTIVGLAASPAQFFRRLSMPAIKESLASDDRPPVLFLRSFQDDDLYVRIHPRSRASAAERLALLRDSTFEDLLAWQAARAGPVIAIGKPGTVLQPLGAVRDYFDDSEWQVAVLERIDESAAVIFVVGRSPGAQWELSQLRERGALGKTLFVFPPIPEDEFDARCFVISVGLGLHPLRLNGDINWGVPLVAMRIGPAGEVIRYFADGRDDIAYGIAVERGLSDIAEVTTIVRGPADQYWDADDAAQARSMLVTYSPFRKSPRSSDPFRRSLSFFLDRAS